MPLSVANLPNKIEVCRNLNVGNSFFMYVIVWDDSYDGYCYFMDDTFTGCDWIERAIRYVSDSMDRDSDFDKSRQWEIVGDSGYVLDEITRYARDYLGPLVES